MPRGLGLSPLVCYGGTGGLSMGRAVGSQGSKERAGKGPALGFWALRSSWCPGVPRPPAPGVGLLLLPTEES